MENIQSDLIYSIKVRLTLDTIKSLIDKLDNVNYGTNYDTNPLLCLCGSSSKKNTLYILQYLIDKGVDVNTICNDTGDSAVIMCCRSEHFECVDLLLSKGADMNIVNKFGKSIHDYYSQTVGPYYTSNNYKIIRSIIDKYTKNNIKCANIMELLNNDSDIISVRITIKNANLDPQQLCDILIFIMKERNMYLTMINDYLKTNNITLSSFGDKFTHFIKNSKLSSDSVCFLILNDYQIDNIPLDDDILPNDSIKNLVVIKLLKDLLEEKQKCAVLEDVVNIIKEHHDSIVEENVELKNLLNEIKHRKTYQ